MSRLPRAETERLIRQAQAGDARAMDRLIDSNLPMVWRQVRHYRPTRDLAEDMEQAGRIGLAEAVQTFDFSRGTVFSTHAFQLIRKWVVRCWEKQRYLIRPPLGRSGRAVTNLAPGIVELDELHELANPDYVCVPQVPGITLVCEEFYTECPWITQDPALAATWRFYVRAILAGRECTSRELIDAGLCNCRETARGRIQRGRQLLLQWLTARGEIECLQEVLRHGSGHASS